MQTLVLVRKLPVPLLQFIPWALLLLGHLEGNAVMINKNSEDSLAQVEEVNEKYEVESGMSLDVKGNLKKN